MSDYIKREDAINLVNNSILLCIEANDIERIPAADVRENVRGKWIHTDAFPHKVYCSVCFATYLRNEKWAAELPITLHPNFCPNCGADMRGSADG